MWFEKKPGGWLHFCIDYGDVNSKTMKNRYTLPLLKETLYLLWKAQVYNRRDVRGAYNLLRVVEGDKH